MRRRIAKPDWPVMPRADDLPPRDGDRADRNLAFGLCAAGLGNGFCHKLRVFNRGHMNSRLTLAKSRTKIDRWGFAQ